MNRAPGDLANDPRRAGDRCPGARFQLTDHGYRPQVDHADFGGVFRLAGAAIVVVAIGVFDGNIGVTPRRRSSDNRRAGL